MNRQQKRESRFHAMSVPHTKFLISRRLELHDQFKDRRQRDKLWYLVITQLTTRFSDFHHSLRQVKKRYENVRLRYNKERNLVAAGRGPPTWEYWSTFEPYGYLAELDIEHNPAQELQHSTLPLDSPDFPQRSQSLDPATVSHCDLGRPGQLTANYSAEDDITMTEHVTEQPLDNCVGFIGAGKMATAMANGFINSGLFSSSNMCASCPPDWDSSEIQSLGVTVYVDNHDVAARSDILILAVKPDVVAPVLKELAPALAKSRPLILSVAAGITIDSMEAAFHAGRFVRVMPNTPALNPGYGATVFCPNKFCSPEDTLLTDKMLSCLGFCSQIPEKLIDAVTGLSGSGPAYVFTIIEALSDGGVKMGLPKDLSTKLAAQTVLGAAKMVVASGIHPAVLRDNVASPGGTTIHGLHALEQGGLRNSLINAVEAATRRAKEMGEESKKK